MRSPLVDTIHQTVHHPPAMKRTLAANSIVACVCLRTAGSALAQVPTGQISGRVTDSSGAVLPGVDVTVTQTDTGLKRSTVTNDSGQYAIPSLPLGPYR